MFESIGWGTYAFFAVCRYFSLCEEIMKLISHLGNEHRDHLAYRLLPIP